MKQNENNQKSIHIHTHTHTHTHTNTQTHKHHRRSQSVAIKQVSYVGMHNEIALKNFFHELSLMKKLRPHGKNMNDLNKQTWINE